MGLGFTPYTKNKQNNGKWENHAIRANTYDQVTIKGSVDMLGQAASASLLFQQHANYVLGLATEKTPDFVGYTVLEKAATLSVSSLNDLILKMGQLVDYCLQCEAKAKADEKPHGLKEVL